MFLAVNILDINWMSFFRLWSYCMNNCHVLKISSDTSRTMIKWSMKRIQSLIFQQHQARRLVVRNLQWVPLLLKTQISFFQKHKSYLWDALNRRSIISLYLQFSSLLRNIPLRLYHQMVHHHLFCTTREISMLTQRLRRLCYNMQLLTLRIDWAPYQENIQELFLQGQQIVA